MNPQILTRSTTYQEVPWGWPHSFAIVGLALCIVLIVWVVNRSQKHG